ncbi:hypothetical protein PAAG_07281 [Paracoccidioides lutzii Pb01]|uniref:ATP-dependent DNA ligase family profile domain-containing protein n=1 Tax=Paracoccidioides lutzii (strain ATCC MYA-826 / Pb01) TaxID=502779 RepID=C1H940_PARBA|nr:hypothetical protein PAAG_07281 [Paracoccidioides lutzii Pb01]EEH36863.2 hypothetical protein PAAG_07281 [Paracoccidioides lutzii Pb01]
MGFKFSYVCDLFSNLEANLTLKVSTASIKRNPDLATIESWFSHYAKQIHDGKTDRLALLSCLFPERRPERVFGLKEPSLVKVIGRCLLLGVTKRQELDSYRTCGNGDLGNCVERVMKQAEDDIHEESGVTVEEIDNVLNQIASRCRFSGPDLRRQRTAANVDEALSPVFRRLTSREAKWFTRIILKDISPVTLPAPFVLRNFQFHLPDLLLVQDSFGAALDLLSCDPMRRFPPRPDPQYAKLLVSFAASHIPLTVGIKVGRPIFYKARGVKHCCKMAGKRTMSVERKYDGEYCQIHINLAKRPNCIQIFSKSGRDSTADRSGVHSTLKECLRIGKSGSKISRNCILEGELLVWSDVKSKLLPFHKLRKHVARSGSFIGAKNDSQPHPYEHLYIMFFDILLINDDVCLPKSYRERRVLLKEIVNPVKGRAVIVEQEYIDFSLPNTEEVLKAHFSRAISQCWEGLVLKGSEEPYFAIDQNEDPNIGHWIKLKKDYITGLGDTADFAIVGARYDAREATKLVEVKGLTWTSFFVGCREKNGRFFYNSEPVFRIVDVVSRNNMNIQLIRTLNQFGQFCSCVLDDEDLPLSIRSDQIQLPEPQVLFKTPFVVEMLGGGFKRRPGVNYFTLRFPRVLKIHNDRDVEDATTLEELQMLAKEASSVPTDELSQERVRWEEKLEAADGNPGYIMDALEQSSMSVASGVSPTEVYNQSPNEHRDPLSTIEQDILPELPHSTEIAPSTPTLSSPKPTEISIRQRGPKDASQKRFKRLRSQSPCITIRADNTHTMTNTSISNSQDDQMSRHLANLTNLSQSNTNQTNHRSSDSQSVIDLTTIPNSQVECMATPGQCTEVESQGSLEPGQQAPSQSCSQDQLPSKVNVGFKRRKLSAQASVSLDSIIRSTNLSLRPPAFLSETPILRGTGVSHNGIHLIFHSANQHLTSSFADFLDSPNALDATQIASDIAQIGNLLAAKQRVGTLPVQRGKILFLHWKAFFEHGLIENSKVKQFEGIREQWEKVGEKAFAGCLKWGYGMTSLRRKRKQRIFDHEVDGKAGENGPLGVVSSSPPPTDVDVQLSFYWREI